MTVAIAVAVKWGGVLVCAFVLAGCICRLDMLKPRLHKRGWLWMYTAAAPFAAGVLIDLVTDRAVDWYCSFGLAAIALHLLVTRHLWRGTPPAETLWS